jgi:hypothetical protein
MFSVHDAEAITALTQLRHLRLDACVTAPLTRSISQLTQLTSLEVNYDDMLPDGFPTRVDACQPGGLEVGRRAFIL